LDKDAVAVIEGGVEKTTELLKEKFDHIFFTGNGIVGKTILKAAAEHLTPVTLELGGKSPCIIDKTADLDVTAKRILWAKFLNLGQTCVAPDYLLVEKSIESDLLQVLKKQLVTFFGEDAQKSMDYSRIINQKHVGRLSAVLDSAKKEGVEVVTGGTVHIKDNYIAPTIIRKVKRNSILMSSALFGPILPVLTVESLDEAVQFVVSKEKPLAAYLFSKNKKNQKYFLENTPFGGGCINDLIMHVGNNNLPFGGVGPSGMGSYHGIHSFKLFSHHKPIVHRSFAMDVDMRYPPYTPNKVKRLVQLQSIKLTPTQLVLGIGTIAIAGVAIFIGTTQGNVITTLKSYVVWWLQATITFIEKL